MLELLSHQALDLAKYSELAPLDSKTGVAQCRLHEFDKANSPTVGDDKKGANLFKVRGL